MKSLTEDEFLHLVSRSEAEGRSDLFTIRTSGEITFNKGAREIYLNGESHAVLYYDDEEKRVGIEPVADETAEGARPIRTKGSLSAAISAKAFFDTFNLSYAEKQILSGDAISIEDKMIILQL